MRLRTGLPLGCLLLAASCATLTTNVKSDPRADFSKYRTFRMAGDRMETGDIQKVQDWIAAKLESKGLKPGGDQADLNVVTRLMRGPQQGGGDNGYTWWEGSSVTGSMTTTPEGTFVVDLVDRAHNQLVWRGEAQGTIPSTGGLREEKVRIALDRMFADYPPKKKSG